jgi:hypothetical protein
VNLRTDRRHAHLLGAVEAERTQVAALELVDPHDLPLGLHQDFRGVRNVHHVDLGRVEHPLGVLLQPEDCGANLRLVGAHALEYGQAVVQGMGEDVGVGLSPGHELAVVPDLAVAV